MSGHDETHRRQLVISLYMYTFFGKNLPRPVITLDIDGVRVCGAVDLDASPTWVAIASPILPGNPPDGCTSRRLSGVIALKDFPYKICLLRVGSVGRPSFGALCEYIVGDNRVSVVLDAIDPAVADTITELLLLAPEDRPREVRLRVRPGFHIESLAQYILDRVW